MIIFRHRCVQTLKQGEKVTCAKCGKNDCRKLFLELEKNVWLCEDCDQ